MNLLEVFEIKEGESYYAQSEQGEIIQFKVIKIDRLNKEVTVDFNHPLAGKTLVFNVKIKSIRDATKKELEHGHPH